LAGVLAVVKSRLAQYEQSQIEWNKLRQFAIRVARETKAPSISGSHVRQESRTREARGGFLGLSKRTEHYKVPVSVTVCTDYWLLDRRLYKKVIRGRVENTIVSNESYCLGTDGSLFVLHEGYEGVFARGAGYTEAPDDPHVYPMNETHVMLFDFEPAQYNHTDGPQIIYNNNLPDRRRLKYHTKGVGISMALKKLLVDP
jgi:hypothetical protein